MSAPGLTTGAALYQRTCRVTVGGTPIADYGFTEPGHDIAFRVSRNNQFQPNECEVVIHGLAKTKRDALTTAFEAARAIIVNSGGKGAIKDLRIEAGYAGIVELLAQMDITNLEHERGNGGGYATIIHGQDGIFPFGHSFVNESIAPGVDASLVMKTLQAAMGVAFLDADSEKAFQEALPAWTGKSLPGGMVLQGPSRKVLLDMLSSMRLTWSFQNGKLQLMQLDGTTTDLAVLLSPQTGLRNEPKFGQLGACTTESALIPALAPGRQVSLVDGLGKPYGQGIFRVDEVEHTGGTYDGDWTSRCKLRPSALPGF